MLPESPEKVIIVEGKTDKKHLLKILQEPVEIICTFGTLGEEKVEEILIPLQDEEVYVLVDADESGNKLRKKIKRELPNARHLYTRKMYGEVATTPLDYLAKILADHNFEVDEQYIELNKGKY